MTVPARPSGSSADRHQPTPLGLATSTSSVLGPLACGMLTTLRGHSQLVGIRGGIRWTASGLAVITASRSSAPAK